MGTYFKQRRDEMTIKVGTKVRWESSAGKEEGVVRELYLALNGYYDYVPWFVIEIETYSSVYDVTMCATQEYMNMMKLTVVDDK